MYAIIETGGKQYRVSEGDVVIVERLDADPDAAVEFPVLAVGAGAGLKVGTPLVEGARVTGRVLGHGRANKVLAFRYKSKKNVRRRRGHRQHYTRVRIEKIQA
ncbi:MAG: 50S ribosomal protein L21 [Thermaerobacter sp.]|nr:50S ribosomal protein L21 [Bacillota bacterium]REJ37643.1 MAG: 50S ribosomal protein L21 [Bacillota bacterium]